MTTKKTKILVSTNYHKAFTGFGKNCKNILSYLYSTGKYEIIEFANGIVQGTEELKYSPWKVIGSVPNDRSTIQKINADQNVSRLASYGHFAIDDAIKKYKPDVYIGIEDIWAFSNFEKRKWWNKINCMIWTTIDSLPILPQAMEMSDECENFYVWASFAEKAMNKAGKDHVKTLHGSIDTSHFFKIEENRRNKLRKKFGINDSFIIGFVFRNQLRKSVPNLLDGFKIFLEQTPHSDAKLFLHTHWKEGWDINRLCQERDIDISKILTTYVCKKCKNYLVHKFIGHDQDCPYCKEKNSFDTTSTSHGITEQQLNEVYNLMDVYCHPFTSGGQEIPIQEAKLCELITLATNYSCGEDMCSEESAGIPLEWSKYSEPNTQFIKASTDENSIASCLSKVFNMTAEERSRLGSMARKYIIDNYSSETIGKKLEEIIDSFPEKSWDFNFESEKPNPDFSPDISLSDEEFAASLYSGFLKINPTKKDINELCLKIKSGASKQDLVERFKQVAIQTLGNQAKKIEELLDPEDKGRIGICLPPDGFICICASYFISGIKNMYKDHSLYIFVDGANANIFEGNKDIKKILPITEEVKDQILMEGAGDKNGYFDVFYNPSISELMATNYSHNCKDKSECIW